MATTAGSSLFARGLGVLLLIEGAWGLFSDRVFGIFTTNRLHAVIHIALGVLGVVMGFRNNTRDYLRYVGSLLVAVGIVRFIPFVGDMVVRMFNVNFPLALFNIAVGLTCLSVSATLYPARRRIPRAA